MSYLLLLLALVRVLLFALADPMLGYGNNFDMHRTSGCIALWPAASSPSEPFAVTREAPLRRYVVAHDRPAGDICYQSTDGWIAGAVTWLSTGNRDGAPFDLRWIGWVKALLLIALMAGGSWLLRDRPGALFAHALASLLVLADPVNLLFLHTLYTEFAAYTALYGLVLLLASGTGGRWLPAVFALALSLARIQTMFLPAVLLALAPRRRYHWPAWVACAVGIAVQMSSFNGHASIVHANAVDTLFGALLPAAGSDPVQAAGLPESCAVFVGAYAYASPELMRILPERCPQAFEHTLSRRLRILALRPLAGLRAVATAIPLTQSMTFRLMGVVEGRSFAGLEQAPWYARPSLQSLLNLLPSSVYVALVCLITTFAAVTAWANPGVRTAQILLLATGWYAIVSSVLGDGYADVAKHSHLLFTAFGCAAILCAMSWRQLPAVRAAAIAFLLWGILTVSARPFALVDVVRLEDGRVKVSGLAIASGGPKSVRVTHKGVVRELPVLPAPAGIEMQHAFYDARAYGYFETVYEAGTDWATFAAAVEPQ